MSDDFLSKIYRIIQDNLGNEAFSVEDLAMQAGISRSMMHRKLKKLTGKSASDIINEIRVTHAKGLLEGKVATVSEVAYQVGFRDPSYFSKVFKKYFGVSPVNILKNKTVRPLFRTGSFISGKLSQVKLVVITSAILVAGVLLTYFYVLKPHYEKSIAVLPLRNLTGYSGNDFFVDGMHDALVGELSRISSLRVISNTSARQFRGSNELLPEIAVKLGVNSIVEGSVLGVGDSVKVLLQLIDVFPNEKHLFFGEYTEAMPEVVNIQKKAAQDITSHIGIKLNKTETEQLEKRETVNSATYIVFLRGMYEINEGTDVSIRRGLDTLARAIRMDPGNPYAHGGYALGKAIQGHGSNIGHAYFQSAIASAEKALIIDRTNYMAHTAMALIYLYQYWDWEKAGEAFRNAINIHPNNDVAHAHYAWYHVLFNNHDAAIHHARLAVDLDPLSSTYKSWLAWLLFIKGDLEQAEILAMESLRINNMIPWGNLVMGWICLEKGLYDEALSFHERLPDQAHHWRWFKCRTYVLAGQDQKALKIWEDFNRESEFWINPYYKGMVAGVLGYSDKAYELLKEACENNYYPAEYINSSPSADFIRNYSWFNSLLFQLNLPDKE
jgi:AraC-like DNA-binding protein/TolB-like protein